MKYVYKFKEGNASMRNIVICWHNYILSNKAAAFNRLHKKNRVPRQKSCVFFIV